MRVDAFSVPLKTPLSTAADEIREREGFLVRVDGGIGEATPLPGWTESVEECHEALAGIDDDPETGLDALDALPAARHGLSLALADREARERGVPLYRHLGGNPSEPTERLPVNATVGDGSPGETAETAHEAIEAGFGTVKCKVGARDVEADIERVRAVREAIGPEPALRLDANGGWSREEAPRALDALAEFDVEFVEQPLPADDISGHRALSSPVPLALDEALAGRSTDEIESLADAADLFVLKPMALGGVDRAVELGKALENVVVTTTIDAVVARTATVHAAAALAPEYACGLATADLLAEDLGPDPTPVSEGTIPVPEGPGLGIEIPVADPGGGEADA